MKKVGRVGGKALIFIRLVVHMALLIGLPLETSPSWQRIQMSIRKNIDARAVAE